MEVKDVLEFLSIEGEIKDLTELKTKFEERFVPVETLESEKKKVGSFGFEVEDTIKKTFGLEKSEMKDKTTKEIVALAGQKVAAMKAELEAAATKGSDEQVLKLKTDYEKLLGQANQYKSDLEKTAAELEAEKQTAATKIKEFRLGDVVKSAKSKLNFIDGVKEIEKIGFDTLINQKYKFDFDEQDNPIVIDAKTNSRVPNPKKTGQYLGIEDVMSLELETAGLAKKNNLQGNQRTTVAQTQTQTTQQQPRPISPAAAKRKAEMGL